LKIDVPTAVILGDKVVEVAAALHQLGCPLVLDDFGLRTECFNLLRLPAVRYVKLAAEITAKMRSDKLSQAAITAVVQMARVLGMHTVAKRTETAAEHEWLTALGVDFVQSNALSPAGADRLVVESAEAEELIAAARRRELTGDQFLPAAPQRLDQSRPPSENC
jgi:PTS system cellobiose-specific IIC component